MIGEITHKIRSFYDFASFTVTNGQTDYNVATQVATLFKNVTNARYVEIIATLSGTRQVSIKFNATDNPAMTLSRTRPKREIRPPHEGLEVKNIYITNASGATITFVIFMTGDDA